MQNAPVFAQAPLDEAITLFADDKPEPAKLIGKVRVEGKDHVVRDGDEREFLLNV